MISSSPLQIADPALRIELENGWELLLDASASLRLTDVLKATSWREARVGLSWNAQFPDLREYMGAAWYRVRLDLPEFKDTQHVLLKFGAVDYFCEVFVNGWSVGTHEGGYTPFSFEITSKIQPGLNELVVHVIDPPVDEAQNRALFPEMMYNEIPHGKQNWYVQNSGIWQGVRIEICPSIYVERLDVTTDASGEFMIEARLAGTGLNASAGRIASATDLRTRILDNSGRTVFDLTQKLDGKPTVKVKGRIDHVELWSPESPMLYSLEASLTGRIQYRRLARFGFRSFEAKEGKLYLNSEPFYMRAALDQDFYPETVHTPTSQEYVRDMMVKAQKLGFNVLRCHLKVAHPVYLDVADEVGMLIWTELPSWSDTWFPSDHFSAIAAARTDRMFWEILIRDWNHPSIVIQTIMNESWGINLTDGSQRAWLKTTFDHIKGLLAPLGRLVVDNSACEGNFHIKSDLDDFHQYYSMPDQVQQWDKWVDEFAQRPSWTYSPHGDSERTGAEPLLVSEFGNWGLPKLPVALPWWSNVNFGQREITRPSGVIERFKEYKLDTLFTTFNEMAVETQWHQFASLKHEIESIRRQKTIQGYVITGITDVHWEVNGLLDMWRREKVFASEIAEIQTSDLIMCRTSKYNFYSGEQISVETLLSHYSSRELEGARIRWSTLNQAGGYTIKNSVRRGDVAVLDPFEITLGSTDIPRIERLQIDVRDKDGHRVSENSYDLFVFPQQRVSGIFLLLNDKLSRGPLADRLAKAGYDIVTDGNGGRAVLIASTHSAEIDSYLSRGGRVLMLIDSEEPLPSNWEVISKTREGSDLDGRWISNHNWVRSDRPPFSDVAFRRILGFEAAKVVPNYVLQHVRPDAYDDVLSGITYGWLNKNAALTLQMRVGRGSLILTTFNFDSYGSDPYATHLLDSFLRYINSLEFLPQLTVSP